MSYILDALKKSEQQRQRGAVPSLLATQAVDVAPRQPGFLFYGVGAAILLVVGIAIGVVRPWQAQSAAPPAVAMKSHDVVPPPPPPVTPPAPAPAPAPASVEITIKTERVEPGPARAPAPAPVSIPAPIAAPPASEASKASAPASEAPKASAPAVSGAPAQAPIPAQGVPSTTSAAPADKPLPLAAARRADTPPVPLAELPLAVQQEIPKLSIQFHMYSRNPANRMAGINNSMLREGDPIAPGLVLEQITPEGMVVRFKEYRFLLGNR